MALHKITEATRIRDSFKSDINRIIERLGDLQRGTVKRVDIHTKQAGAASKRLREAVAVLDQAITESAE